VAFAWLGLGKVASNELVRRGMAIRGERKGSYRVDETVSTVFASDKNKKKLN